MLGSLMSGGGLPALAGERRPVGADSPESGNIGGDVSPFLTQAGRFGSHVERS